jgi:DNA-binding transcriptional MerR regulator
LSDTALFHAEVAVAGADGPRIADGKEEGALRTIGEVAKALGIRQHVLRYWEEQFPMLKPLKRSGGRRYYRPDDIALVETIDRLVHHEGFTLRGARQALSKSKAPKTANVASVEPVAMPAAAEVIVQNNLNLRAHLITLRTTLAKALDDS